MDVCMDGWMTCDFMSFLNVFQSYQDDGWVITQALEVETLKHFRMSKIIKFIKILLFYFLYCVCIRPFR